jgi:peptide/nickel transport system ATP-binding protein
VSVAPAASAATTAPLVALDRLSVSFPGPRGPVPAVDGVTLSLAPGETLALLGESGSGKSLTALAVAGLLPAEARMGGRIDWPASGGRPLLPGRDIGFVFQDPMSSLNPVLTIGEQVAEVLTTHAGQSWRAARHGARDLLARTGFGDPDRVAGTFPHRLSGGMRQRAAIAMAIAAGPRLLIADEPTTALDTSVQAQIMALLAGIAREGRTAILMITHDVALAGQIAGRAAVLYAGRVVEAGPMERLLSASRHPYVRGLLAAGLDFDRPARGRLPEIPGGPPDPGERPTGCPFAPRCPEVRPACALPPPWVGTARDGAACILPAAGGVRP